MGKTETNFIGTSLQEAIDTIERLTERFFATLLNLRKEKEKENLFILRYREIENTTLFEKVIFCLVLFLLPILIAFDYATLKNFIDFIHSRFSGIVAEVVTYTGVFVFIGLEILSGVRLVLQQQKIEREGGVSSTYMFITYGLVFMAITIPSMIIIAEHQLMDGHEDNFRKMIVLVIVSLVIHIVFFASVDRLLQAFVYIYFKIKKACFKSHGIEGELKKLKPFLRKAYREYDHFLHLYLHLPEEEQQINHELGKKELVLRDQLSNRVSTYEQDFVMLASNHQNEPLSLKPAP